MISVLRIFDDTNIILNNNIIVYSARNSLVNEIETSFYKYIEINAGKNPFNNLKKYFNTKNITVSTISAIVVKKLAANCTGNLVCAASSSLAQIVLVVPILYVVSLSYCFIKKDTSQTAKHSINCLSSHIKYL